MFEPRDSDVRRGVEAMHTSRITAATVAWVYASIAVAQELDEPAVLGDSYSDIGNAAAVIDVLAGVWDETSPYTIGLCNPADFYFVFCDRLFFGKSRVSDDRLIVEYAGSSNPSFYLVELLGRPRPPVEDRGLNYAVASATARGPDPEDLTFQVSALLGDVGPMLPPHLVVMIEIGGNDVVDAVQAAAAAESLESSLAIIHEAVEAIAFNVTRLLDAGGTKMLVFNVPNLGALPAVDAADDRLRRVATRLTRLFNTRLRLRLNQVQASYPRSRIRMFDLYRALERLRTLAGLVGINVTDACFDGELYRQTGLRSFDENCEPDDFASSPDWNAYLFWDDLHLTGWVHAAIGQTVLKVAERLEHAKRE
jgi:phospholipase/lecithinase/hemolysin